MPESASPTEEGQLSINNTTANVKLNSGHKFNGKVEKFPNDKECILILDHKTNTVTIERLTHNINLTKSNEANQKQVAKKANVGAKVEGMNMKNLKRQLKSSNKGEKKGNKKAKSNSGDSNVTAHEKFIQSPEQNSVDSNSVLDGPSQFSHPVADKSGIDQLALSDSDLSDTDSSTGGNSPASANKITDYMPSPNTQKGVNQVLQNLDLSKILSKTMGSSGKDVNNSNLIHSNESNTPNSSRQTPTADFNMLSNPTSHQSGNGNNLADLMENLDSSNSNNFMSHIVNNIQLNEMLDGKPTGNHPLAMRDDLDASSDSDTESESEVSSSDTESDRAGPVLQIKNVQNTNYQGPKQPVQPPPVPVRHSNSVRDDLSMSTSDDD